VTGSVDPMIDPSFDIHSRQLKVSPLVMVMVVVVVVVVGEGGGGGRSWHSISGF